MVFLDRRDTFKRMKNMMFENLNHEQFFCKEVIYDRK